MKPTDNEEAKLIKFWCFDKNLFDEPNDPVPMSDTLPEWYRKAERYIGGDQARPTWKACMSFMDAMSVGYALKTPADIFIQHDGDDLLITIDEKYKTFLQIREAMDGFVTPDNCYPKHIAIYPQWGVELPEGYSALYTAPLNRFEQPFVVTNGIIENDTIITPGLIPVFLKSNFQGCIPKGTPFIQIFPFKRENWTHAATLLTEEEYAMRNEYDRQFFRSAPTGVYRKKIWKRKVFK